MSRAPAQPRHAAPERRDNLFFKFGLILGAIAAIALIGYIEYRFSFFQARYFSSVASQLKFQLEPGPSNSIRFPQTGPYDHRLGYAELPTYLERLDAQGYKVRSQARLSPELSRLIAAGYSPPYPEKDHAGLSVLDCRGETLFRFSYPERRYPDFSSVPRIVIDALLFIENRELLDITHPTRNPAVEWARFGKAAVGQVARFVNADYEAPGGSTLATQLEKYRHSPGGVTGSVFEKLRQMFSASLRIYANGADTTEARRQIVLDYLNTVPFAAVSGYGEVNGLGDGLWAWYGAYFVDVNRALKNLEVGSAADLARQAKAFRQVLSLLIAQRRPSWFLGPGAEHLAELTDSYVRLLAAADMIPEALRDATLQTRLTLREDSGPPRAEVRSWKAANVVRYKLVSLLETSRLYDIDRLDLSVKSTLDGRMQDAAGDMLQQLRDPEYVKTAKLQEARLLAGADPSGVLYSFTLYERGRDTNVVRVQTDSFGQPFDTNEGAKLELGSTAKLRTLATYLDVIAALHDHYSGMNRKALRSVPVHRKDALTRWTIDYLLNNRDPSLAATLEAAMERRYSANPGESFFTGGGLHTFSNFKHEDDAKAPTVREALRDSVNLAFVRVMRDIVHHYMYRSPESPARLLEDEGEPKREAYLARFADREGTGFIRNFYKKYRGLNPDRALESLLNGVRPTPVRLAVVYRSVRPEGSLEQFRRFLRQRLPSSELPDQAVADLYEKYSIDHFSLQDRGYLVRVHPLELWLVGYLRQNPKAPLNEVVKASAAERQEVYAWLFKSKARAAQDKRINMLVEIEAFNEIHNQWKRVGYPFGSLVPSYATAIGVSGDRPASLAELIGIILNNGVRLPTSRVAELHFAPRTPYETIVGPDTGAAEQVMAPEVAATLKRALLTVVETGTARRMHGAFSFPDKTQLAVGGKTGTGDNRVEVYGGHGQLLRSKAVNRTATFVFFLGDRYFGVITAYVPASVAQNYNFTSALPVQILKNLAPQLLPHLDPRGEGRCQS